MSIILKHQRKEDNIIALTFLTFFKTISILAIGVIVFILTPDTHAVGALESSYFDKNILLESNSFNESINSINIGEYSFSSSQERKRYLNAKRFFQIVKADMRERFLKNDISTYKAADMINELQFISYYLNEYFRNIKAFETTGNTDYKNIAKDNLLKAERGYRNLANITRSVYSK